MLSLGSLIASIGVKYRLFTFLLEGFIGIVYQRWQRKIHSMSRI